MPVLADKFFAKIDLPQVKNLQKSVIN